MKGCWKRTRRISTLFVVTTLILSTFLILSPRFSNNVSAQSTSDAEFKKALAEGLYQCYINGVIGKDLTTQTYKDGTSVIQNDSKDYVKLPSGYTDTDKISCKELLSGTSKVQGLYELAGITPPAKGRSTVSDSAISDFLTKMGYIVSSNEGNGVAEGKRCVNFHFTYETWVDQYTIFGDDQPHSSGVQDSNYICFNVDQSEKLKNTSWDVDKSVGSSQALSFSKPALSKNKLKITNGTKSTTITLKTGESWSDVRNSLISALGNIFKEGDGCNTTTISSSNGMSQTYDKYCRAKFDDDEWIHELNAGDATGNSTYTIPESSRASAFRTANSTLLNTTSRVFTDENVVVLYQNYLKNYYNSSWKCDLEEGTDDFTFAQGQGYTTKVRLYEGGSFKNCYVKLGSDKTAFGFDPGDFSDSGSTRPNHIFGASIGIQDVVNALNALAGTVESLPSENAASIDSNSGSPSVSPSDATSNISEADVTCSKAAGGLGWILCSAGNLVANALSGLYDYLEQYLAINASLISTTDDSGEESGVYRGWSMFRDIANILFVIYLLAVILSQLTGFGIDNYGIKKALPRLVIAAILINLSFVICQLAVDFSNIFGASINGLFESLAKSITISQTGVYEQAPAFFGVEVAGGVGLLTLIGVGGLLVAGGGVAGIAGAGVGATLGAGLVALLFAILGVAISAFLAVLGLWLILVIRQSIIVIGIVCAPIAFASYSLDGAKKSIFDPWFKIMKSMIILYPLCGFVVGAGLLASRIMLTTGNNAMTVVVATVIQIGPYFFLPKLFRSSLNAVGKLSGLYDRFTSGIGNRVKGAYNDSRFVRQNRAVIGANRQRGINLQDVKAKTKIAQADRRVGALVAQIQRQSEANYADKEIAQLEAKRNKGEPLSEAEQDRLSKAYMERNRQKTFQNQLSRMSSEKYAERARTAEEERQRNFDELAFISDLQQVGSANFSKYSGGENTEAITDRIYELLGQSSLSQEEEIELNGLSRYLAITPGKESKLLGLLYDGNKNSKGEDRRLTGDALLRFNQMRLKNHDVNAMLGRKDRTTAMYLSELTSDNSLASYTTNDIGNKYAKAALTDVADVASQSASALRQYSGHLSEELIRQALENRTILSDVDKQNALKNNAAFQVAEERENLLRIQHTSNQKILVDEELKVRIGKGTTRVSSVEIPSGSDTDVLRQSGLDLSSMHVNPTTGKAEGTFNNLYSPKLNDGSDYSFKGGGKHVVDPMNNHVIYSERFLRKGATLGSTNPNDYLERRFDASTGLDLPTHDTL